MPKNWLQLANFGFSGQFKCDINEQYLRYKPDEPAKVRTSPVETGVRQQQKWR